MSTIGKMSCQHIRNQQDSTLNWLKGIKKRKITHLKRLSKEFGPRDLLDSVQPSGTWRTLQSLFSGAWLLLTLVADFGNTHMVLHV